LKPPLHVLGARENPGCKAGFRARNAALHGTGGGECI
jgi:hypothetical protein